DADRRAHVTRQVLQIGVGIGQPHLLFLFELGELGAGIRRDGDRDDALRRLAIGVADGIADQTDGSGGKQVPWENSSLMDSFYFITAPPPPSVESMQ
ncbi:hypothetical protein ACC724_37870, partial [Rhizobium ruizarguesonis]